MVAGHRAMSGPWNCKSEHVAERSVPQPLSHGHGAESVVGAQYFKVGLWVVTGRAYLRSIGALMDKATVAAAPDNLVITAEHGAGLKVSQQITVLLLVLLFSNGNVLHYGSNHWEAFLTGNGGILWIHVGPFLVFAISGSLEVGCSVTDYAGRESGSDFSVTTLEELEQALGVLLFLIGGFFKHGRNQNIAFVLGYGGIVVVAVTGLRLTDKGG